MYEIKQAEFLTSVANAENCPDYGAPEIAVAGKSNVGKSSFVNFLANYGGLAKTSATAGKTRLLNYFSLNKGDLILVDLPGYGFAKVSDAEKTAWGALVEGYLQRSGRLKNVFLLIDIRRVPDALDRQMLAYMHYYSIPFTVVATKSDKLSKQQISKAKKIVAAELGIAEGNVTEVSALKKTGKAAILSRISQILE